MKIRFKILAALFILITFNFTGCISDGEDLPPVNKGDFAGFDFATVEEFNVNVHLHNRNSEPVTGVYAQLFTQNPITHEGVMVESSQDHLLFTGISDDQGTIETKINPATRFDTLYVLVKHTGFPLLTKVALERETLDIYPGATPTEEKSENAQNPTTKTLGFPAQNNGYYVLGEWAYYTGNPYYLDEPDQVSNDLLNDINASLPEGSKLPETHPQYLSEASETNLVLIEDAEVWVTFIHEGAGYKNALGYYTYPTGNPPATVEDINDLTIIFPNASYFGSGGNLFTGDKVQLMYLQPEEQTFTNVFPEGVTVAWFLVADGFGNGVVDDGRAIHYSNSYLNQESTPEKQRHNVLLYDEERELMIIGFEDMDREGGSDDDFNDAVFYSTVTPFTAVLKDLYQPVDTPEDSDNDGVSDTFDDYPNDPDKAFMNEYPAPGQFGTLIFEDLWPSLGDYDFNDMVIDYNYDLVTNLQNEVTKIEATFLLRAIGASYKNGFGFTINTDPENVSNVTGQRINRDIVNPNSNGTEANQTNATFIVFDDAYTVMTHPGGGTGINTSSDQPFVEPVEINISITFNTAIPFAQINAAPFNPFIFVNGNRQKEVHLPMNEPTDLADMSFFGTKQDESIPEQGIYYSSGKYLPWAINLPESFTYLREKEDITQGYLNFTTWATSQGTTNNDWYLDVPGYRNQSLLYDIE